MWKQSNMDHIVRPWKVDASYLKTVNKYNLAKCLTALFPRGKIWIIQLWGGQFDRADKTTLGQELSATTVSCHFPFIKIYLGKSILQVPDTGTWVLDNTRPFLRSSIVSFWITPARSKERTFVNITFSGNTGTPEMFQYSPILGHSSIWDLKYTFSYIYWIFKVITGQTILDGV